MVHKNNYKLIFNILYKFNLEVSGGAILILMCFKSKTFNLVVVVRRLLNLLDVC